MKRKEHMAIVIDEHGLVIGLVTLENVIEEIVGEIMDEHDNERPLLSVLDDSSVLLDARLEIEKLEEHFGIKLPEGAFESVGGFIIHILGKIPKVNEKIVFEYLEMVIKSADDRKIDKILVTYKNPSTPPEEDNKQY